LISLSERIRKAKHVYLVGNGGSYANSIHICNDLLSVGVRAYTMDIATFSAFSNDYGYYTAFERWIKVVGEPGDLLIALSGSGRSPNILKACDAAQALGMDVERIFGAAQGLDMQAAEELQIRLGHDLRRALFKGRELKVGEGEEGVE